MVHWKSHSIRPPESQRKISRSEERIITAVEKRRDAYFEDISEGRKSKVTEICRGKAYFTTPRSLG